MTHLPYIAGAYGIFFAIAGGFALQTLGRVRRARRRLAALDQRSAR